MALHLLLALQTVLLLMAWEAKPSVAQSGTCGPKASCSDSLESQENALRLFYNTTGGPEWASTAAGYPWGDNTQKCSVVVYNVTVDPRLRSQTATVVSLPSHCCWAGVQCCLFEECYTHYDECNHMQCNCTVGSVTAIVLMGNNLQGSAEEVLSNEFLDPLKCSLRRLSAPYNALTGALPPTVSELQGLQILNFGANSLNGSIPEGVTSLLQLSELDLSSNRLTGTVPPLLCGERNEGTLRDLLLSNNRLSGPLGLPFCEDLIYLDVQNNQLTGTLPDFSTYHQLHILRVGNNSFSGTLPTASDIRLVSVLDLSKNRFSGELPTDIANMTQLTLVSMGSSNVSGTLPRALFGIPTLAQVQMQNNSLRGTLPDNIGSARGLSVLRLQRNQLLQGTLPDSLSNLVWNNATVDFSNTSLSCCGLGWSDEQMRYSSFNYSMPRLPRYIGLSDTLFRPIMDDLDLKYMRCPVLVLQYPNGSIVDTNGDGQGDEIPIPWSLDPEYFLYDKCYCIKGYDEMWQYGPMGKMLVCVEEKQSWAQEKPWAVALIIVAFLFVLTWITYWVCFRRGKRVALLQNYYNLRKRVKGEPLGGQVSIVVTDIEGYSDLMKQSPELMTRALNIHNAVVRKARWANFGYTVEQEGDSYSLVFYEALDAVIFCLQTQLALNRQAWPEGLFTLDVRDNMARRRAVGPAQLLTAITAMTTSITHSLFGSKAALGAPGSGGAAAPYSGGPGAGGMLNPDESRAASSANMQTPRGMLVSTDGIRVDSRQSSVLPPAGRELSNAGHHKHQLFNGIRVRMGIATGLLPPGSLSKGSAVMEVAKLVSDAGAGGQVLMDQATFMEIKERMEELGAVDHNGMNFKKLNAMQPPWYSCLLCLMRKKRSRNPDEALLLDMGEYTYSATKRLPLFTLEATPQDAGAGAAMQGAAPPTPRGGKRSKGPERVRLFQIAPPALVGRTKVFGTKLALKEEWVCSDAPYFAAPGTAEAPVGFCDGPVSLPPITMAFTIADNGKNYVARHRRDARRVHDVIAACIRATLNLVAGGYLCRMQDGDLKYMVAFSTPQAAVSWALMLQELMLYAEWPESALRFWKEEFDDMGQLLFRGPRMKVGLCEGNPRSIIPDHIGRADYHGASINQAARYMDAAAHGGMVALEVALAQKVIGYWTTQEALARLPPPAGPFASGDGVAAATAAASGPPNTNTIATLTAAAMTLATVNSSGSSNPSTSVTRLAHRPMSALREVDDDEEETPSAHGAPRAAAARPKAPWAGGDSGVQRAGAEAGALPLPTGGSAPNVAGSGAPRRSSLTFEPPALKQAAQSVPTAPGGPTPSLELWGARAASTGTVMAPAALAEQEDDANGDHGGAGSGPVSPGGMAMVASLTQGLALNLSSPTKPTASKPGPIAEAADAPGTAADPARLSQPSDGNQAVNGGDEDAGAMPRRSGGGSHPLDGPSMTSLHVSDSERTSAAAPRASAGGMESDDPTLMLPPHAGSATASPAALPDRQPAAYGEISPVPNTESHLVPSPEESTSPERTRPTGSGDPDSGDSPSPSVSPTPLPPSAALLTGLSSQASTGTPGSALTSDGGAAASGTATPGSTAAGAAQVAPLPGGGQLSRLGSGRSPTTSTAGGASPGTGGSPRASMGTSISPFAAGAGASRFAPRSHQPPPAIDTRPLSTASSGGHLSGSNAIAGSGTLRLGPLPSGNLPLAPAPSAATALGGSSGTPHGTPTSGANAVCGLEPSPSMTIKSPRPPALALPTDKERDAVLAVERDGGSFDKHMVIDGPLDCTAKHKVLAFRIGQFKFKGNPEDIPMCHIILEVLAKRRFSADAPKGKGAKTGDASGLVAEATTQLPDLAARMKERWLATNPARPLPHEYVSLNSSRRLKSLLGGGSFGSMREPGHGSPRGQGGPSTRVMYKSQSVAPDHHHHRAHLHGLGAAFGGFLAGGGGSPGGAGGGLGSAGPSGERSVPAAGLGAGPVGSVGGVAAPSSGVGSPSSQAPGPAPGGSGSRKGSPLVNMLTVASASVRWASAGFGSFARDRDSGGSGRTSGGSRLREASKDSPTPGSPGTPTQPAAPASAPGGAPFGPSALPHMASAPEPGTGVAIMMTNVGPGRSPLCHSSSAARASTAAAAAAVAAVDSQV